MKTETKFSMDFTRYRLLVVENEFKIQNLRYKEKIKSFHR